MNYKGLILIFLLDYKNTPIRETFSPIFHLLQEEEKIGRQLGTPDSVLKYSQSSLVSTPLSAFHWIRKPLQPIWIDSTHRSISTTLFIRSPPNITFYVGVSLIFQLHLVSLLTTIKITFSTKLATIFPISNVNHRSSFRSWYLHR